MLQRQEGHSLQDLAGSTLGPILRHSWFRRSIHTSFASQKKNESQFGPCSCAQAQTWQPCSCSPARFPLQSQAFFLPARSACWAQHTLSNCWGRRGCRQSLSWRCCTREGHPRPHVTAARMSAGGGALRLHACQAQCWGVFKGTVVANIKLRGDSSRAIDLLPGLSAKMTLLDAFWHSPVDSG